MKLFSQNTQKITGKLFQIKQLISHIKGWNLPLISFCVFPLVARKREKLNQSIKTLQFKTELLRNFTSIQN